MRFTALLVTPLAVLVGLERPPALFALLLLAAFAAGVARVGLWLLDDLVSGNPDAQAARAGLCVFAAGTALATSALLVGPLTVWLVPAATVLVVVWLRPGRAADGGAARRALSG